MIFYRFCGFLAVMVLAFGAGKLASKLKMPVILGWLIRRDGAGAPCAEPAGPADAGRGLVRQCGTPFGVRCGPDNRHRAAVEKAAQCRAADPGHHRDRIAGHLCSGQPGVCLRVPHHGRAGLSGVFVPAASCWPQRPRPRFPL